MFNDDSKMKFVNKAKDTSSNAWKILIVDDEEGVHTIDDAVAYLIDEKDKHFDPKLVDLFLSDLEEVREVYSIK
ncbi:MAG TPA: hypothetical protein EYG93_04205 [Sulfurospirillum arcachonense]|nr:hypothetical protein [Sulfurospirillum arcachonense]HIP44521.1 hypothetical protein [Sulfurospirillum arcachonense]